MKRCVSLSAVIGAIVTTAADAQQLDAKRVFERCAPSVVCIETPYGLGAGFFVNSEYIVTNKHVIQRDPTADAEDLGYSYAYYTTNEITVELRSGQTLRVVEVNAFRNHPTIDVAVLRVRGYRGIALPLLPTVADVGEQVVAIGHPLGSKWTQTTGTISNNSYETSVQLNVALDPGNSGGPILNAWGQVVGVVQGGIHSSRTADFGIRSDVLLDLLTSYGIRYSTEPITAPTTTELDQQLRQLKEERSALTAERIEFERERTEFETKMAQARPLLDEYDRKLAHLTELQSDLDRRESDLLERQRRLDARERELREKELRIAEKLGEHFSLDLVMLPAYDIEQEQFIPLRAAAGLYYRFGFVRNYYGEVESADKFGVMVTRQLSPVGWVQDEVTVAIEFSSLVRFTVGAIVQEPDQQRRAVVPPSQPRYTASLLLDFMPSSPWFFGLGINAQTDHRFQWRTIAPGIVLGYEFNFFRW